MVRGEGGEVIRFFSNLSEPATMVDLSMYIFKDINTEKITPEAFFTDDHVEEVHEPDHVRTATKRVIVGRRR